MNSKTATILAVILILAGAAAYFTFSDRTGGSGQIACTAEALQCPDGSFVGRGGVQCQFSACPNQESFVGILRQGEDGFSLILPAPEGGQAVSYAMPITIKISNALGELVGQKVRVFGKFTTGASFLVDRLEALEGEAGNSERGEVRLGESVFINGVRITLNKIVSDSRCPTDVVCVWAGNVTANLTLQSDTDKETLDMISDEVKAFDSYKISMKEIRPSRLASTEPLAGSYSIVFEVAAN